ncbi:xylulokinase [Saccharopolyspora endophytica]|uniref:Xylulose kinase n=1 Tax=Saccharopolyspora endophytica TaxID=543886 RepID=A0ABS5DH76_9PSEU|nr:xylulokinase [Saccharopolyspora endophytica]MBQ0925492.1 xylulokinase [Saccharopolyspora endophytica]
MLIGIDLGTSTCKVIAVNGDGEVLAKQSRDYAMINLRQGWAEQDPAEWWRATDEAITALTASLPEGGREVSGIGLCGQMHGLTALDASGDPLRHAILWNDQRAAPQCDWITERAGGLDELLRMTRNRMLPGFTGGKIVWFRENEPELFARTARVLNPKDYLRLRMTGTCATDVSDASGTGLFDVARRAWSDELLQLLDIDRSLLPDVVESTDQTGRVKPELAERWNVPAGTPVFGGGGDAVIQTTAMGLVDAGAVGFTLGTAGIVAGGASSCPDNPGGRVQVSCGNAPGRWHCMGVSLSAGGAFQWLRDALAPATTTDPISFDRLIGLAQAVDPGSDGLRFLPYLLGERSPHVAPEATGSWVGLTPIHHVGHLARSVMEGVLLNLREILEVCGDAGLDCERVIASGGATSESLWLQMLADVLDREIAVVTGSSEGGAYGAAMAAGVGAGVWEDFDQALAGVSVERTFVPQPGPAQAYDRIFPAHRALYDALKPLYQAHAEVL